MRCSDVLSEIQIPTGQVALADLSAHLNACPRCVAEVESARQFDRLWAETRPNTPSELAWDNAWSRIQAEVAAPAAIPVRRARFQPVWLAAAALITVSLGLAVWFRSGSTDAPILADSNPGTSTPSIAEPLLLEVPVGQTVLYSVDDNAMRVVQVNQAVESETLLDFYGPDEFMAFYGLAEFLPEIMASNHLGSDTPPHLETAPQ